MILVAFSIFAASQPAGLQVTLVWCCFVNGSFVLHFSFIFLFVCLNVYLFFSIARLDHFSFLAGEKN